jgi:hypothetical protein
MSRKHSGMAVGCAILLAQLVIAGLAFVGLLWLMGVFD